MTIIPEVLLRGKLNGVKVDYWTPFNPSNEFPRPSYKRRPCFYLSAIAIQGCILYPFTHLTIGIYFPGKTIEEYPIHKLRLYATATNLLTFTEFKSYSPELTPWSYPESDNMYLVSMFHSKIKNPYEKLIYTAFVICGMLTASCSDLLNLESKTDVTNNYLFTTPEGLNTTVTGLYS